MFFLFLIVIFGLFSIISACVYILIPQHCRIFMFTHGLGCVCVCTTFLSFRCLVLCILNNVKLHQLYRVSLGRRTHSSPNMGILRFGGE
jgi:hypothetical protein